MWAIGYLDDALDADVREGYAGIQRLVIGTYSLRVAFLSLRLFILLIGSDNLTSDILLSVVLVTTFTCHIFYICHSSNLTDHESHVRRFLQGFVACNGR